MGGDTRSGWESRGAGFLRSPNRLYKFANRFCQLRRRSRRRFLLLAALRGIRGGAERRERYRFCQLTGEVGDNFLYLAALRGIRRGAEQRERCQTGLFVRTFVEILWREKKMKLRLVRQ